MWNNLWRADLPHSSFDILDVVFTTGKEVTGWLFTMADGKVKSKSKGRWKLDNVAERCRDYDGNICGQIQVDNSWYNLDPSSFAVNGNQTCIVSTAQATRSHQYIEQVFEKQQGIIKPKMTSYRLCDSTVKGQSIPSSSAGQELKQFPTERLICSQKQTAEIMKEKMNTLIHILEQRSKFQIHKLSCVFVVEDIGDNRMRVRLHHAKEIVALSKKSLNRQKSSGSSALDTRSEISDMTNMSRGSVRRTKCVGDFCSFSEEEEGSLAEMDQELNFDIALERGKAQRRHKRINEGKFGVHDEKNHLGNDDIDDNDADEENADAYRAHVLAATGGGRTSKDPVHPSKNTASASSGSFKVPVKSLLLARKDMKIIDSFLNTRDCNYIDDPEVSHWWSNLFKWYKRAGHAVVQKSLPTIPASSGHHIGRAMLHAAEHGHIPDEGSFVDMSDLATNADRPELTVNALQSITEEGSLSPSKSKFKKNVPFDLNENPYTNSQNTSGKHLGRYYSTATVCDACYHVYKELDRLRKKSFKVSLKQKKMEAEEKAREDEMHLARHMESIDRQTNQKVMNFRLAKSKYKRPKKGSMLEENSQESFTSLPTVVTSTAGAPKGQLPPRPWQLGHNDKRREYEQQGSSFVRNIQNKAQMMSESAAIQNKKYQESNYGEETTEQGLEPNYDWRKMVASQYPTTEKSTSAGNLQRRRQKPKPTLKKRFNSDRLLHPYQRELAAMRRGDDLDDGITSDRPEEPIIEFPRKPNKGKLHHSKSESNVLSSRKKQQGTISLPSLHQKGGVQRENHSDNDGLPPLVPKRGKYQAPVQSSGYVRPSVGQSKSPVKSAKTVSFSGHNSASRFDDDDGDSEADDEDDDDDDEIGWSPFMIG